MIAAGLRYFAIVFAVAFALGTIRTLWLTAAVGATMAVVIEVPLILAVSFVAARAIVVRDRDLTRGRALGIGAIAFALLMLAESSLSLLVFGTSLAIWFKAQMHLPGAIGLLGQLLFALMPLIARNRVAAARALP